VPGEPGEPGDELLTAYVDGITEIGLEDRHRIEARLARDPAAREEAAAVRGLLAKLRTAASASAGPGEPAGSAEPAEPAEPDWAAMERSIRLAVGTEMPRPWWRRWRWLAPAATFATAATAMALMWTGPGPVAGPAPQVRATAERVVRELPARDDVVPLWLDGDEIDVDLSASELLGEAGFADDAPPSDAGAVADEVQLLPSADLAWVDHLDDAALARAERWLAGKKG
jgi:hypothetical protein